MELNKLASIVHNIEGKSPVAEYHPARLILMHQPGEELFDGVIHPAAALYEHYFDVDAAAAEHQVYQEMLRKNGITVLTVREILLDANIEDLRILAASTLVYDTANTSLNEIEVESYRKSVLEKMSKTDLVRTILLRPSIHLHETQSNTGLTALYEHNPLMNLYFMRDQTISTPKGQIICRLNSPQRHPESDIVEFCYKKIGITPIHRIQGTSSFLEGGDYIPFGEMCLIGQGLRTTQEAIDEMLAADVIGHDTLVVVRDHLQDQYQMHLDTYFNIIDKDLATMCFNRYDAQDESDPNFLTVDVYTREPGSKSYHEDMRYHGLSFKQFLDEHGVTIIRIQKSDADHYANNFLAVDARHIMSVAGQSEQLCEAYEKHDVKVEWVPLDNLIGGYGAAHCMTQVLKRVEK